MKNPEAARRTGHCPKHRLDVEVVTTGIAEYDQRSIYDQGAKRVHLTQRKTSTDLPHGEYDRGQGG
jgi:hypothetical protein